MGTLLLFLLLLLGSIAVSHALSALDATYCCRRSSVVCVSVCLLVTFVSGAKTAQPIEMPFGG